MRVVARICPYYSNYVRNLGGSGHNLSHQISSSSVLGISSGLPASDIQTYHYDISPDNKQLTIYESELRANGKGFDLDHIYNESTSQYDLCAKEINQLIEPLMNEGQDTNIVLFNSSSVGNKFTLEGPSEHPGIFYRALDSIFAYINNNPEQRNQCNIRFCCYQITNNEMLRDCFLPGNTKLRMREDDKKGSIVEGATEVVIKSVQMGIEALTTARRESSKTAHTVLSFIIERVRPDANKNDKKIGQKKTRETFLNFISVADVQMASTKDTPGSGKSHWYLALNTCLTALEQRTPGVPFHKSKLTLLLKECLVGQRNAVTIISLAPASRESTKDVLAVLKLAQRIRDVTPSSLKHKQSAISSTKSISVPLTNQQQQQLQQQQQQLQKQQTQLQVPQRIQLPQQQGSEPTQLQQAPVITSQFQTVSPAPTLSQLQYFEQDMSGNFMPYNQSHQPPQYTNSLQPVNWPAQNTNFMAHQQQQQPTPVFTQLQPQPQTHPCSGINNNSTTTNLMINKEVDLLRTQLQQQQQENQQQQQQIQSLKDEVQELQQQRDQYEQQIQAYQKKDAEQQLKIEEYAALVKQFVNSLKFAKNDMEEWRQKVAQLETEKSRLLQEREIMQSELSKIQSRTTNSSGAASMSGKFGKVAEAKKKSLSPNKHTSDSGTPASSKGAGGRSKSPFKQAGVKVHQIDLFGDHLNNSNTSYTSNGSGGNNNSSSKTNKEYELYREVVEQSIKRMREDIKKLENEKLALERDIRRQADKIVKLKQTNRTTIDNLTRELNDANDKIASLQHANQKLRSMLDSEKAAFDHKYNELMQRSGILAANKGKGDGNQADSLEGEASNNQSTTTAITELEDRIKQLEQEASTLRSEKEEWESKLKQGHILIHHEKLVKYDNIIKALTNKMNQIQEQASAKEQELESLRAELLASTKQRGEEEGDRKMSPSAKSTSSTGSGNESAEIRELKFVKQAFAQSLLENNKLRLQNQGLQERLAALTLSSSTVVTTTASPGESRNKQQEQQQHQNDGKHYQQQQQGDEEEEEIEIQDVAEEEEAAL